MEVSKTLDIEFLSTKTIGDHFIIRAKDNISIDADHNVNHGEVVVYATGQGSVFKDGSQAFQALATLINQFNAQGKVVIVESTGSEIHVKPVDAVEIRVSRETGSKFSKVMELASKTPDTYFPRDDFKEEGDAAGNS